MELGPLEEVIKGAVMMPKIGCWYKSDWDEDERYYVIAIDLDEGTVHYKYSSFGRPDPDALRTGQCGLRIFETAMNEVKMGQKIIKKTVSLYV